MGSWGLVSYGSVAELRTINYSLSFKMKNHNVLLILGNGFDLDLGYRTKYSDFVECDLDDGVRFPFVIGGEDYSDLGNYVLNATIHQWYDLENVLAEYGKDTGAGEVIIPDDAFMYQGTHLIDFYLKEGKHVVTQESIEHDRTDYRNLVDSLARYLNHVDYSKPIEESVAAKVLRVSQDELVPPVIYSFNYTDITLIGSYLGLHVNEAIHVHGSLKNDDIILGVGDYVKLRQSVDFMYKTSNMYRSTNLFEDLRCSDLIIIFGLSMSQVDYPYFESFFNDVARGKYTGEQKKKIFIFTKDNESRMSILRNLRMMNNGMINLMNNAEFDIIRTNGNIDDEKVNRVLEMLVPKYSIGH